MLRLKPSFASKVSIALANEGEIEAIEERKKGMAKRSRLKRKMRLAKLDEAKATKVAKEKQRAAKARYNAKRGKGKAAAEGDAASDAEQDADGSPAAKKQKTGEAAKPKAKAKPKSKGKGKGKAKEGDADGEASSDEYDSDIQRQLDAESDNDDDEDVPEKDAAISAALQTLMTAIEGVDENIASREEIIDSRSPEDMWEALGAIPEDREEEFQAEVKKRLKLQNDWMQDQYILKERVDVRAYIVNLPLRDFSFGRIIVDEAQCLRNMESQQTRVVRILAGYSRALHMMSATPVLNKVDDIRSLGSLA